MINLDDRLIKEVSPKIKPNALSVLLAIAIHLNKQNGRCFPSHRRLMELTGLGRDAVYTALEVLKKEGLLKSFQAIDSKNKSFGRRVFAVSTRFISIFVTADDAEPLPENPDTAHPDTAHPDTANQETYPLNEVEQLNEFELINQQQQTQIDVAVVDCDAGVVVFDSITLEAKEVKSGLVAPPPAPAESSPRRWDAFDIDREAQALKEDYRVCEKFAIDLGMGLEIAKGMLPGFVDTFVSDQKAIENTYNNRKEFRTHFFNLVRKKAEIARNAPGNGGATRTQPPINYKTSTRY